jgi:hypothetical protein
MTAELARTTPGSPRVPSRLMSDENGSSLAEQLEEIRIQLGWVRDYL